MVSVFKQYIKEIIKEVAKDVFDASDKDLALYTVKEGKHVICVLYSPNFFKKIKNIDKEKLRFYSMDFSKDYVYGYIVLGKPRNICNKASSVENSAAKSGYGPLMYDIAMAMVPNNTIVPSRDSISNSAKSIWDYYYNNRIDVKHKPLDDELNPVTPDPTDDCPVSGKKYGELPTDYSYRSTSSPNISALKSKHEEIIKEFGQEALSVIRYGAARFWKNTYANTID